jgi:hypothetical protein
MMSVKDLVVLPATMKRNLYGEGIDGHTLPMLHKVKEMQGSARLACALIERWGIVAAEVDGEDSAGRSRLRRLTPDELVKNACETADAAMNEFEKRGWLIEIPMPVPVPAKEKEEA